MSKFSICLIDRTLKGTTAFGQSGFHCNGNIMPIVLKGPGQESQHQAHFKDGLHHYRDSSGSYLSPSRLGLFLLQVTAG